MDYQQEVMAKAKAEQRRVGGSDFTRSDLLRGRTQGEIGALKWLLRECDGEIGKDSSRERQISAAIR